MEPTMLTGDRLIVNRLPVTLAQLQNVPYLPERGQVIVFENPRFTSGLEDQYIVKRVVGLPGDRVVVNNGVFTIFNRQNPDGLNPDATLTDEPNGPAVGAVDVVVPEGELFVVGDNRVGNNSYDSRSGLGTIPLYDIVGPVGLRVFPFTEVRGF